MPVPSSAVDAVAERLRRRVRGEVRFDEGSRALYSTDASNYRQMPIGVVIPRDAEDVMETVAAARAFSLPLLSRGGGTSLAGQCCNVAIVMDFSKYMNAILEIDPARRLARVQPGVVLDSLRATARRQGLTFAPDPATHNHCTLGGMLGNNACGTHSLLAAKHGRGLRSSDNTHELDVVTYDGARLRVGATTAEERGRIAAAGGRHGEIYTALRDLAEHYEDEIRRRFPRIPRRVSGYNLDELLPESGFHVARALVGTEGTCVTIVEASLHLVPEPAARSLLVLGYADAFAAADHVPLILEHQPTACEGLDDRLFDWVERKGDKAPHLKLLPEGRGWLLVELAGDSKDDVAEQARRLMDRLAREPEAPALRLYDEAAEADMIWRVREGGLGSTAWVPGLPDTWSGWEDSAVAPEKVGAYFRRLRALFDKYGYNPSVYGHFGQGCLHCRVDFDLYTEAGVRSWRAFMDEATDLVVEFGGSLSGEHGDGQARGELLPRMYGEEIMEAFRRFKSIWDPDGKMNPGKVIDARPFTSDLRVGPHSKPLELKTHFRWPEDQGSFARAALRCVGVGECRRASGSTMCPSYRVTMEEEHSTRGRARLLFEMASGTALADGWKNDAIKEALDLCLACKGCKGDCPVNVDMASYKAEFLSHYYEGRRRPRHAYAFGFIHTWARLASVAPWAANFGTQTPGLAPVAKWLAGAAPARRLPLFARRRFKSWFREHAPRHPTGPPVVLWADTFNDFFHPDTARAAVAVLEEAGFRVEVPEADLCCGRPLYDYGFLETARKWLEQVLEGLGPALREGRPIVVLEPSCWAVFQDELPNLFPGHDDARRLKAQAFLLAGFLRRQPGFRPPVLSGTVLVHAHCHQKALTRADDEAPLLADMGLDVQAPDTGCCGMAGAFGFEKGEHYEVSVKCGERALLPVVRRADEGTVIVADGFSCREQIAQSTSRRAMHLAEVLWQARRS